MGFRLVGQFHGGAGSKGNLSPALADTHWDPESGDKSGHVKDLGLAIKIVVVLVIALAWLAFFGNLFYRSVTEGWELTATLSYGGAIFFMLVWAVYQFIPKKKKNGAK